MFFITIQRKMVKKRRKVIKKQVLVVDDDSNICNLFYHILSGIRCYKVNCYDVKTANNGIEGLKSFEQSKGRIDLIITDIIMPGLDGIEMVNKIMESQNPKKPYVIFMSGQDQLRAEEYIKQNGLTDIAVFLGKPFKLSEVYGHLKKFGLPY